MARLTIAQLIRKAEIFVTNGALPEAQAVLSGVGYGPTELTNAQTLVNTVKAGHASTKELLAAQKNATKAEHQAQAEAAKEIVSLSEVARILFAEDEPTLTALGLQTQYETVVDPETGEETQQAVQPSESTAQRLIRWRQLVTNAPKLESDLLDMLIDAGWTTTRLSQANSLVEAYAAADTEQQDAIQNYQATSAQFKDDTAELRQWYRRARAISSIAIKDNDPQNLSNLRELLGLDAQ